MDDDIILKTIARVLVPFLEIFGLYVVVQGLLTPGGGFQGGVLMGTGIIIYSLAFGVSDAGRKITPDMWESIGSLGALVYVIIGVLCILFGGSFLEYSVIPLPVGAADRNALLVLVIMIGIGIKVMSTVVSLFLGLNPEEK